MFDKVKDSSGFTLVELLIVIGIISVIAVIAIPQYKEFKSKSHDATAQYSIKSLINAEEAIFADSLAYVACTGAEDCQNSLIGFKATQDVEIEADLANKGYSLHSCSKSGLKHYVFDSADSPGKFARSLGIPTNTVGATDSAPDDANIGDNCTL